LVLLGRIRLPQRPDRQAPGHRRPHEQREGQQPHQRRRQRLLPRPAPRPLQRPHPPPLDRLVLPPAPHVVGPPPAATLAPRRVLVQARQAHRLQVPRHPPVVPPRRPRLRLDVVVLHQYRRPLERRSPGQHLVEHHPQGVLVAGRQGLPARLLRRHVQRRA